MQIGIMSGTFTRSSLEDELDALVDHGLNCMQFDVSSAGLKPSAAPFDAAECGRIKAETSARNISLAAINCMWNMIDPDLDRRAAGLRYLERLAPCCEAMGTSVVALATGSRNPKSMWLGHPDNNSPEAWRDLVDVMGASIRIAEQHNITLAFEPEVSNTVDSAAKAVRLIDEMGSPNLKVIMDCANIFHTGELPRMREIIDEAFDLLGEHVAIAHAKDLDRDGHAGHLAAGQGVLDYEQYLSLLNGLGYDVPLILHGLTEEQVDGCVAYLKEKQ